MARETMCFLSLCWTFWPEGLYWTLILIAKQIPLFLVRHGAKTLATRLCRSRLQSLLRDGRMVWIVISTMAMKGNFWSPNQPTGVWFSSGFPMVFLWFSKGIYWRIMNQQFVSITAHKSEIPPFGLLGRITILNSKTDHFYCFHSTITYNYQRGQLHDSG